MDLQPIIDELLVAQREFNTAERAKAAAAGDALSDGSYPIEDVASLEDAIQAYGRSKDKPAAKALIKRRARELGHPELIPDGWNEVKQESSTGFIRFLKDIFLIDQQVTQDLGIPSGDDSAAQPKVGVKNPQSVTGGKKRKKDELDDDVDDETTIKKARVTQEGMVLQIDEMKRVVTGVVQTPDIDVRPASMPNRILVYPKSTVQQMAWSFLKGYHNGSIGLRHGEVQQGQIVPQKGENATVVESYIAPVEMTFPNGKVVAQGSWIMAVQINNDAAWNDVQRGDLRAFSLASTKVKFSSL